MELTEKDLEDYVRLAAPDAPAERHAQMLARIREAVAQGERRLADTRIVREAAGHLRAAVRLAPAGGQTFFLVTPLRADAAADADAAALVPEAMERARAHGARIVRCRPDAARVGPHFTAALRAQGFRDLGERVEFKAPVESLPSDEGTPFAWRDLAAVGEERAAAMLQAVAEGDPHSGAEGEDPRAEIADWLSAAELTQGPECVQVGFLEERAVAFVCAQVSPETGWSRIAYLGLVPDLRGRGLGRWVHCRGFRMLKEQGGREYHGGTSTSNAAMLRLFRRHGCAEAYRMLEFEWSADEMDGPRAVC